MVISSFEMSSSYDSPFHQYSDDPPGLTNDPAPEFSSCSTSDEPTGGIEGPQERSSSFQEFCNHRDENIDEMHKIWGCYRALMEENKQLRNENASLRAQLMEVQMRIDDMSAAVTGKSDTKERVRCRVSLEERRNELVKLVTRGRYPDWSSYQTSDTEDSDPYSIAKSLELLAGAIMPELHARAQVPTPVQSEEGWKARTKRRSKQAKKEGEAMEAEYAIRVQDAREAQQALVLLQDKELWDFILQSC